MINIDSIATSQFIYCSYVSRRKTYVKAVLASALCLEERVEHDTRRANGFIWQSQFVACSDGQEWKGTEAGHIMEGTKGALDRHCKAYLLRTSIAFLQIKCG